MSDTAKKRGLFGRLFGKAEAPVPIAPVDEPAIERPEEARAEEKPAADAIAEPAEASVVVADTVEIADPAVTAEPVALFPLLRRSKRQRRKKAGSGGSRMVWRRHRASYRTELLVSLPRKSLISRRSTTWKIFCYRPISGSPLRNASPTHCVRAAIKRAFRPTMSARFSRVRSNGSWRPSQSP